jgi:23S rRNA pseudouridine1911/1915/1917 synthase
MTEEKKFTFKVTEKDKTKRVDLFILEELTKIGENASRNLITKYKDNIFINSLHKKPSAKIKINDNVTFMIPEVEKLALEAQEVPFDIVYEDNDIIVINKPPGIVVHPAKGNLNGTIVQGLLNRITDLSAFNNVLRPGIVHRLDKDTSGLLIVAKNINSHNVLTEMFKNHKIQKIYWAIVSSDKLPLEGKIEKPLSRHPKYRKKFTVSENGKYALTYYKVIKSANKHSLLEIELKTGRTHQIRVHLAGEKAPIVGDTIYSKKYNSYNTKGLALVAKKLQFYHPTNSKLMQFEIEIPSHFLLLLKEIKIFL